MIEFSSLMDLADKLGFLQAIKNKLISQPDPAAEKFILALDEISRIYSATESELARYLSVHLEPGASNREARETLVSLESGTLSLRWSSARGHCHVILNIYDKYLDTWFARVLKPDELGQSRRLFSEFGRFEGGFLDNLDAVTDWLSDQATKTLDLLDEGKVEEANAMVRTARKAVLPYRKQMSRAVQQMLDLQAELVQILGIA